METQEQILKEQRLKIETLRYRILLRYYELLLTLDVMTQPNEVKTLMGYINTLERYAKKYETKPVKKKSGKRKEHIDEIPVTDENTGSEETDYMPDNPSNLFDLLEDSDETYPPEADVLPTDIDDFLRAGYARYLKQKENKEKNNPAHPQLEDSQPMNNIPKRRTKRRCGIILYCYIYCKITIISRILFSVFTFFSRLRIL